MWAGLHLWGKFCIHVGRFAFMVTSLHSCGQVCIYGDRSVSMWAGLNLWQKVCIHVGRFAIYGERSVSMWAGLHLW
jgi:hypothetical protein